MVAPWDRRPVDEQQRIQAQVLSRWLPSATQFCGHWADVAARHNLEPELLDGLDALQHFPTSRERELVSMSGPGATGLVMRPTDEQVKAVATTKTLFRIAGAIRRGGQSALRRKVLEEYKPVHVHQRDAAGLAVAYSRRDLDRLHLAGARAAAVLGLDSDDYLVSAVAGGPNLAFWGAYHLGLGASMLTLHPRGHGDDLGSVVESFRLLPTTAVAVELSEAERLADLLHEADATVARVHTIVCLGPIPGDDEREAIAEAWRRAGAPDDVRVLALWAPPEARSLWAEQRANPGSLVTYPDLEVVEVVDPLTGLPTDGPGDLTISSIGWTGTALLRYQTGSYVGGITTDRDPVTGRTVPRILPDVIPDAWQPDVLGEDGRARIDLRGIAATVGPMSSVDNWIVEIRKPTTKVKHDRVIVDLGGSVSQDDLEAIARQLPTSLGVHPETIRVQAAAQVEARLTESGTVFVDLR